jgi:Tol biopolymer transport system component
VLHAIDVSTGVARELARGLDLEGGAGVPGYDLSPDGRTVLFPGRDGDARTLLAVPSTGGTPVVLARVTSKSPLFPRFSPDGSGVAFADTQAVYLVGPGGGAARKVAELPAGVEPWSIAWSPDGSRIAVFGYPSSAAGGNNAVFVLPADGNGPARQVSDARDYKEGLAWSPAGDRLTYHLSRRDSRTVQIPAAGGPETPFHDEKGVWDYRGIWGPDGHTYYFEAAPDAEPAWRVYQLDLRTGTTRLFARNNASLPGWSRGGAVVWSESPTVANQLWLLESLP